AVADPERRDRPERSAVRVGGTGVDSAETARVVRVVGEHHLKLVHALVVEGGRSLVAVDLEGDEVVAPVGVARGLDRSCGAAGELDQGQHFVVDVDFPARAFAALVGGASWSNPPDCSGRLAM